jgi:hypothetical protein
MIIVYLKLEQEVLVQVENNIKIEMIKYPTDEDWLFCKQCALNTIGKDSFKAPTEE